MITKNNDFNEPSHPPLLVVSSTVNQRCRFKLCTNGERGRKQKNFLSSLVIGKLVEAAKGENSQYSVS